MNNKTRAPLGAHCNAAGQVRRFQALKNAEDRTKEKRFKKWVSFITAARTTAAKSKYLKLRHVANWKQSKKAVQKQKKKLLEILLAGIVN